MTNYTSFFDEDLNEITVDFNIDTINAMTNDCQLDIDELTIIDSLPAKDIDIDYAPCHLSRLSIHATPDRPNYETPAIVKCQGYIHMVEGGSLWNHTFGDTL